MIDVKTAINIAINNAQDLFGERPILEEVEKRGKYWLITVSLTDTLPGMASLLSNVASKRYKIIEINGDSLEVESVKIRKL
jgi:hypothetical protein